MRVVSSAGFALAFLLLALPAAAQTGKLAGTVTDAETGETLIGATVRIENGAQGAATDIDGQYQIIGVRPGTYNAHVLVRRVRAAAHRGRPRERGPHHDDRRAPLGRGLAR